jgi:DNA repair exonuclease SbcCD ATPase subunit
MNGAVRDAKQLLRLRTLRVQRARDACAQAQAKVEHAEQAVQNQQREVQHAQRAIKTLAHKVVHSLAPHLPRWADVAAAQRERLHEALERAEYTLVEDEHQLEQAQEALQQARAELTRALAREDAVRGLAHDAVRAVARVQEQRVELEMEDQIRRRA